ncbi:MAG: hypothetical protein MMC23_000530 [Stictis urceolatum]|nr:hypothetical protein [Stictis urceolata]
MPPPSAAAMLRRALRRPRASLTSPIPKSFHAVPRRTLIAPPSDSSGPLMERRSDRELPNIQPSSRRWLKTLPIFLAIVGVSSLAIFNYQKSSSSVVNSTLYALRTSPEAREILGDEIYFRDRFPWIWGELNQLHGRIDIGFGVKGKKGRGFMKFRSARKGRMAFFETQEWSLETEDGTKVDLLKVETDPFRNTIMQAGPKEE